MYKRQVEEYEPLAEVMTDKVTAEIPATNAGVVKQILISEGDTVAVGTPVLVMEVEGAESAPAKAEVEAEPAQVEAAPVETKQAVTATSAAPRKQNNGRFSPAVIRLANENAIDLNELDGSGLGGRITRKDVLRYLSEGRPVKPEAATQVPVQETMTQTKLDVPETVATPTVTPSVPATGASSDRVELIPTAGVRQAIANLSLIHISEPTRRS